MTDHQWDKTQWDTTRVSHWVSFVTGHDPLFFNCSQAASKFNAHLHSKLLAKKIKILIFWLVFTSPQVRHPTHTVSTKAYTVKVLSEDLTLMLQASSSNTLANHIRACPIHSLPQVSWWAWKSNWVPDTAVNVNNGCHPAKHLSQNDVLVHSGSHTTNSRSQRNTRISQA